MHKGLQPKRSHNIGRCSRRRLHLYGLDYKPCREMYRHRRLLIFNYGQHNCNRNIHADTCKRDMWLIQWPDIDSNPFYKPLQHRDSLSGERQWAVDMELCGSKRWDDGKLFCGKSSSDKRGLRFIRWPGIDGSACGQSM